VVIDHTTRWRSTLKNTLKACLATLMLASTPFAGAIEAPAVLTPAVVAPTFKLPEIVTLDVELRNNDKVVGKFSTQVAVGDSATYRNTVETTYIDSTIKRDGIIKINPGKVTSGFEMDISPRVLIADGRVVVDFDLSYKKLNKIVKVTKDEMDVEYPDLSSMRITQKLAMTKGESIVVSDQKTMEDATHYTLTIKAS
jgi:hypothetical protein